MSLVSLVITQASSNITIAACTKQHSDAGGYTKFNEQQITYNRQISKTKHTEQKPILTEVPWYSYCS